MPFREETAWLIEFKPSVSVQPTWYGMSDEGVLGMTTDNLKALRFARKQDAEMVIQDIGWTEAFASEHMWCDYSHDWHEFRGLTCCRDCMVVKRADNKNGPCRGPSRLRPMEQSVPLPPQAT